MLQPLELSLLLSQISTCEHGGIVDYVDFVFVTPLIISKRLSNV